MLDVSVVQVSFRNAFKGDIGPQAGKRGKELKEDVKRSQRHTKRNVRLKTKFQDLLDAQDTCKNSFSQYPCTIWKISYYK